jgi:large subunit ribosomal protein L30
VTARKGAGKAASGRIVVEQYRSGICCQEQQKRTLRALGFRRLNQRIEHPDNPAVRGMVAAIPHLVRVVDAAGTSGKAKEAGRG